MIKKGKKGDDTDDSEGEESMDGIVRIGCYIFMNMYSLI